jgi:hypothetical protein
VTFLCIYYILTTSHSLFVLAERKDLASADASFLSEMVDSDHSSQFKSHSFIVVCQRNSENEGGKSDVDV